MRELARTGLADGAGTGTGTAAFESLSTTVPVTVEVEEFEVALQATTLLDHRVVHAADGVLDPGDLPTNAR